MPVIFCSEVQVGPPSNRPAFLSFCISWSRSILSLHVVDPTPFCSFLNDNMANVLISVTVTLESFFK